MNKKIGVINNYSWKNKMGFHIADMFMNLQLFMDPSDEIYLFTPLKESYVYKQLAKRYKIHNFRVISFEHIRNTAKSPMEYYTSIRKEMWKHPTDVFINFHGQYFDVDFLTLNKQTGKKSNFRMNADLCHRAWLKNEWSKITMLRNQQYMEILKWAIAFSTSKFIHVIVDPLECLCVGDAYYSQESSIEVYNYSFKTPMGVKVLSVPEFVETTYDLLNPPIENKKYDFVFSCYLYTQKRYDALHKELNEISEILCNDDKLNVICQYNFNANTESENSKKLPVEEYLPLVSSSKYTLIMPSGNPDHFTYWHRMYYAMRNGTIPLIHKSNVFKDRMEKDHQDVVEFVNRNELTVDSTTIGEKINQLDYKKIAQEMHELCLNKYPKAKYESFYRDRLFKI